MRGSSRDSPRRIRRAILAVMVGAVVLAAGASARMGRPKAALPLPGGHTFLSRVVRTLTEAGLPAIAVVAGADEPAVRRALRARDRCVRVVAHARWAEGQLSSLLAGLDALAPLELEGLLVAPVDVPLVSPATVRALVAAWRAARPPAARPARGGVHGHPVIFDRVVFAELRAAPVMVGARAVIRRHGAAVLDLEVNDPGAFRDFDTPEDLAGAAPA